MKNGRRSHAKWTERDAYRTHDNGRLQTLETADNDTNGLNEALLSMA